MYREKNQSSQWRGEKESKVPEEYTALALYIQVVIKEIVENCGRKVPVKLYTDSKDLYKVASMSVLVEDYYLRLDLAISKESIGKEVKEFVCVEGRRMTAVCLTKRGSVFKGSAMNNEDD